MVAFVQIDSDGRLLATSIASGPDLAALRRAQALSASNEAGLEIARTVLAAKVSGQRAGSVSPALSSYHIGV